MITMNEGTMNDLGLNSSTITVLRRKFSSLAGIHNENDALQITNKVFIQGSAGQATLSVILDEIEKGKVIIIDTSQLHDTVELLIGTMLSRNLLQRYQKAKFDGTLTQKKPVGIVLEEAPRVLSNDVLKSGDNIFSTISKEGRKFRIGLIAITQLTSIIPTTILANMNTKIILGNENKPERTAIINSACQDLTDDDRTIASLDIGEAIISSNFTRFAVPVKFPLFEDLVEEKKTQIKASKKKKAVDI
jgi:DNA helicase HerA-like ATPase